MKGMNEIVTVVWMLFGIYLMVLLLIGADLWSGVRKAEKRGEAKSSYAYRIYLINPFIEWSGYRPNLDSIHTFIPMTTIYVKQKVRRWGVGLQAGYGYPSGVFVGVGVNYNLWQW